MDVSKGIVAFGAAAGGAQALTLTLAASLRGWVGDWKEQTKAALSIIQSGTTPTNIDVSVEFRNPLTQVAVPSYGQMPAIDSVVGGYVRCYRAIWGAVDTWATLNPQMIIVPLLAGLEWRVWARRVGGDATTSAYILATVVNE